MKFLERIISLANECDEMGLATYAEKLDSLAQKVAATNPVVAIVVNEDAANNEYAGHFDVYQNGQLMIGNLDEIHSPIFANDELKAAQNKAPGLQDLKKALHEVLKDFKSRHPQFASATFQWKTNVPGLASPAPAPVAKAPAKPQQGLEFTMGPATVTPAKANSQYLDSLQI